MIPLQIAQLLLAEGAKTLTDASEGTKAALAVAYLDARDWDVEVTFNMREFRDATKYGLTPERVIGNEIYAWAENTYGPQIEFELERLRDESGPVDISDITVRVTDQDGSAHDVDWTSIVARRAI